MVDLANDDRQVQVLIQANPKGDASPFGWYYTLVQLTGEYAHLNRFRSGRDIETDHHQGL
jgi:hypothetical protein